MAELKRYETKINGLDTHIQLTDEQAEARGLTGGVAVPEAPDRETTRTTTSTTADPDAQVSGVGVKEADAPANKSRATRKNDA